MNTKQNSATKPAVSWPANVKGYFKKDGVWFTVFKKGKSVISDQQENIAKANAIKKGNYVKLQ